MLSSRRLGTLSNARLLLANTLSSGLLCGYLPVGGKGTIGAATAAAIYWFLPFAGNSQWMILLIGLGSVVGYWATSHSLKPGEHDPSRVVVDEWVGMWMSFSFLPKEWYLVVAAFLLFRVFDILKPFGIRQLERLPGALGIIADDLGAGIAAAILVNAGWAVYNIFFS